MSSVPTLRGLPAFIMSAMTVAILAARQEQTRLKPFVRTEPRPGLMRNKPCRCGSGRKWKRCCGH